MLARRKSGDYDRILDRHSISKISSIRDVYVDFIQRLPMGDVLMLALGALVLHMLKTSYVSLH
jgi:hypothetical protein